MQSPLIWSASPDWKLDYCNIERLAPEEIARRRAEFDRQKDVARTLREETNAASPGAKGGVRANRPPAFRNSGR